jgi:hypothetical protein
VRVHARGVSVYVRARSFVCVCVCVCARARARARPRVLGDVVACMRCVRACADTADGRWWHQDIE